MSVNALSEKPGDDELKVEAQDGHSLALPSTVLTSKDNKRLLWKIDAVVLPIMTITATFAALDKNALGYAAIFGIKQDTHLKGQEYSWLSAIVYFGYLIMQFPNSWILTKVPPGKFIGTLLILWGGSLCVMAACHSFAGLAVVRFLLGVFEAGLMPTCMILTSVWYRRDEHALRTAVWYNTFAGIFGGILSYAIGNINGSLATWKYIFLIYGSVTIGFGILVMFALPDSPETSWFYNSVDKKLAVVRTIGNQTGHKTRNPWRFYQVKEALRDPKYWVLAIFVLAWSVVNAGITNFNPLIISGYGFSRTKTTLMATPQAAVALISQVTCAAITFFIPNIRCLIWILSCLPALAGAILIHMLDVNTHRTASLIGVYMMGFYNVAWVMVMSLVSSNTGGTTKKAFATVSVAILYCVGNIIGPQLFLEKQAPHYPLGIFAMLVCFAIEILCGIVFWALSFRENKRRDREYGPVGQDSQVAAIDADADDLTDVENKNFRYAM